MHPAISSVRKLYDTLPQAFRLVEEELKKRNRAVGPNGYPFAPIFWQKMAGSLASGHLKNLPVERRTEKELWSLTGIFTSIVPMLMNWNVTRQIYRLDETTRDHLMETESSGSLPLDIFNRLPHTCFYVEENSTIPSPSGTGVIDIVGFWVRLVNSKEDDGADRSDLMFLLNRKSESGKGLVSHFGGAFYLPLVSEDSRDYYIKNGPSVSSMMRFAESESGFNRTGEVNRSGLNPMVNWIESRINILLYLASEKPDLVEGQKERIGLGVSESNSSERPKSKTTYWDVGFREGADFRKRLASLTDGQSLEGDGQKSGVKPHWRRAHWHRFWKGSKNDLESRVLVPRWVAAVPVASVELDIENQPTVRRRMRP